MSGLNAIMDNSLSALLAAQAGLVSDRQSNDADAHSLAFCGRRLFVSHSNW